MDRDIEALLGKLREIEDEVERAVDALFVPLALLDRRFVDYGDAESVRARLTALREEIRKM